MEQKKDFYSVKEIADHIGCSNDLIRLYEKEFNIQVERTSGGHRRYTQENLELLKTIHTKVADGWSYKKVREWLNGDVLEQIDDVSVRTNIEKKLGTLLEQQQNQTEKVDVLTNVIQTLVLRLEEQEQRHQQQLQLQRQEFETLLLENRTMMLETSASNDQSEVKEVIQTLAAKLDQQEKSYAEKMDEQRAFFEQKLLESYNDVTKEIRAIQQKKEEQKKGFFSKFFG